MGSGLVMTKATTDEAMGISCTCGKSSRNTTTTYGQHKTAAIAAMPFANFFSRSQSMPCQTIRPLLWC